MQHFPYRFDKRWAALFFALGVSQKDGVDVFDDGALVATYGRFSHSMLWVSVADPEGLAAAIDNAHARNGS